MQSTTDYLDEVVETVSAQQAEALPVCEDQFALCCCPKLVVKLVTQKLSNMLFCHS
jgi:hypothetical protein